MNYKLKQYFIITLCDFPNYILILNSTTVQYFRSSCTPNEEANYGSCNQDKNLAISMEVQCSVNNIILYFVLLLETRTKIMATHN